MLAEGTPARLRRQGRTITTAVITALFAFMGAIFTPAQALSPYPPSFAYNIELVWGEPGGVHVAGWLYDVDAKSTPAGIHVYVGGPAGSAGVDGPYAITADDWRPDLSGAHGFSDRIPVHSRGSQVIYLYGINVPGSFGRNEFLGSYGPTTIGDPTPYGVFEAAHSGAAGKVTVGGWVFDPNAKYDPVTVQINVGGVTTSVKADGYRTDVGSAHGVGNYHGFHATVDAPQGQRARVCVTAVNIGHGQDTVLRCIDVDVMRDTTPPDTRVFTSGFQTAAPSSGTITFTSTEPGRFECSWNGGRWGACTTPMYPTLPAGTHTFEVRAIDSAGNVDASPATTSINVKPRETTPPPTQEPTPPPTTDPGASSTTVAAKAVRRASRLRIDVGPDSAAHGYKVRIQRRVNGRWKVVRRVVTRGSKDVAVVNLRAGRYRVVVPAQHGLGSSASKVVRLRR